jgi:hypothetical protein
VTVAVDFLVATTMEVVVGRRHLSKMTMCGLEEEATSMAGLPVVKDGVGAGMA